MIKEIKTIHAGEPACHKRSDSDHLRFMVHRKKGEMKFDFAMELNGIKSWTVPAVPSMNPMERREASTELQDNIPEIAIGEGAPIEKLPGMWDTGNYIPFNDEGSILSEHEALESLQQGTLKFFLQGKKLIGEFVLLKKGENDWLLMKRHDEFALYDYESFEMIG